MLMKSFFEEMNGTYRQEGDYLLPNLSLPPDTEEYPLGKYGRMRQRYLKEHRRALYSSLMLEGTLMKHLAEIDRSCNDRLEIIEKALMKQEGVTEALKAADQMEWVRRRNSIRSRAEEVILAELVYAQRECPLPALMLITGIFSFECVKVFL